MVAVGEDTARERARPAACGPAAHARYLRAHSLRPRGQPRTERADDRRPPGSHRGAAARAVGREGRLMTELDRQRLVRFVTCSPNGPHRDDAHRQGRAMNKRLPFGMTVHEHQLLIAMRTRVVAFAEWAGTEAMH